MNAAVKTIVIATLLWSTQVSWAQASAQQVRSWAAGCAGCHGTQGIAQPGMVSLAGVTKDQLLRKMLDFKAGRQPATLMHQISKGYTDEQLEQLAGYFAALKN